MRTHIHILLRILLGRIQRGFIYLLICYQTEYLRIETIKYICPLIIKTRMIPMLTSVFVDAKFRPKFIDIIATATTSYNMRYLHAAVCCLRWICWNTFTELLREALDSVANVTRHECHTA